MIKSNEYAIKKSEALFKLPFSENHYKVMTELMKYLKKKH